jgi:hypothetical protein
MWNKLNKWMNILTSVDQFWISAKMFDKQNARTGLVDEPSPSSNLSWIIFKLIIN